MSLPKLVGRLINWLWLFFAATVITVAVLVSLARAFLPFIHVLHNDIESFLSEKLNAQVTFESIQGGWENQGPKLTVTGIDVVSTENQSHPVVVEELLISVNLWQSLFNLSLVTDEIRLTNSRIEVDLDSSIFKPNDAPSTEVASYSGTDIFIDTLLGQNDLSLSEIEFHFYNASRTYPELQINQLLINNFGDIHQITARMDQASGGNLRIVAELYGDPRLPNSRLDLYLKSDTVHLADLPLFDSLVAGRIEQAALSGEIWVDWSYEGWQQAFMDISLTPMQFDIEQQRFTYQSIASKLIWKKLPNQQSQMRLNQFNALAENGSEIDLSGLTLAFSNLPSKKIELSYQNIEPGKLNNIWALAMDEPELQRWFLTADPQIKVDDIQLTVEQLNHEWEVSKGRVHLSEIKLNRTESTPELPMMSGLVVIDRNKAQFDFSAESGVIDYRPLFRWPIDTDELTVSGEFITYPTGSYLTFREFHLQNQDLTLLAKGNLHFSDFAETELSVSAELYDADAAAKSKYLPVSEMDESLIEYLDSSVNGGTIELARFNMHARLVDDLLEQSDTTFDIVGYARQLDYKYQPDFPKLDRLDAILFFNQDSMFISTTKANLWGIDVSHATAEIPDFSYHPKLLLDINASTDFESTQRLVENSQLKEIIGTVLDDLQPQGRFTVGTRLNIPLEGDDDIGVKGFVELNGNAVVIPGAGLKPEKVNTRLEFTEKRIWAKTIAGELLGGKFAGDIDTQDYDGSQRVTLSASGEVDLAQVSEWALSEKQDAITGITSFQLNSWFCLTNCRNQQSNIVVSSQLTGASSALPQPFAKTENESMPLEVVLSQSDDTQNIQIDLDNKLMADLHLQRLDDLFQLAQGTIVITDHPSAVQSIDNALSVEVNLSTVHLFDWLERITPIIKASNQSQSAAAPLLINFSIKRLLLEGFVLNEVSALMQKNDSGEFEIRFTSQEGLGKVTLRSDDELLIEIDRLALTDANILEQVETPEPSDPQNQTNPVEQEVSQSEEESFTLSDLSSFPSIRLTCLSCAVKGINLGNLEMNLYSDDVALHLSGSNLIENLMVAGFSASWDLESNTTSFLSNFSSSNIGGLLRSWGAKVGIHDSAAEGTLSLSWPGGPEAFSFANLIGGLSLRLDEGHLEEVSDARARIFSLFSLQSLTRRLTLDFSDIYKDGFFYDSMQGAFGIRDGKVVTDNFVINGKAAEVQLSGMVDLDKETLDQNALIIPNITSSLPVLAGWAVEPTTGVLVWLLSKIFEPAIDVVANVEYRMVGGWDSPQVIELGKSTREIELTDEQLEAIRQVHSGESELDEQNNGAEQPGDLIQQNGSEQQSGSDEQGSLEKQNELGNQAKDKNEPAAEQEEAGQPKPAQPEPAPIEFAHPDTTQSENRRLVRLDRGHWSQQSDADAMARKTSLKTKRAIRSHVHFFDMVKNSMNREAFV